MKCVICNGSDIKVRTVDEQIVVGDDIVLIRLTLLVCSQCGERYYDRKTIQLIEQVRAKGKERGRNNFPNYASQLEATFARSQITKISK